MPAGQRKFAGRDLSTVGISPYATVVGKRMGPKKVTRSDDTHDQCLADAAANTCVFSFQFRRSARRAGWGTCDRCAVTMREVPENQSFTSVIAFASPHASLPAVVFVTLTDLNG
jgi:hypothetical protein